MTIPLKRQEEISEVKNIPDENGVNKVNTTKNSTAIHGSGRVLAYLADRDHSGYGLYDASLKWCIKNPFQKNLRFLLERANKEIEKNVAYYG